VKVFTKKRNDTPKRKSLAGLVQIGAQEPWKRRKRGTRAIFTLKSEREGRRKKPRPRKGSRCGLSSILSPHVYTAKKKKKKRNAAL